MAKTYNTYKDSGIAWIGEIPGEWEVLPIKYALSWKSEKGHGDAMVLSLYRDLGIVPKESRDDNHNVTSEKTDDYKFVCKGDFVINKMKAWQGSMALSNYEGIVSPAYYVCSFNNTKVYKQYFHHLLRNDSYLPEYRRLSTGLRVGQWDLGFDDFKNIPFLLPPLSVQQSISSFLDEKCGEIDSLISIQEEMISELLAYKQSVITEAVTKGLDKKAKMKNSGVEWIGDIPEEWEVQKLRTLGWCQNGISKSGDYFGEDYEYPFVSYPDAYKNFEVPYPKGRANSTLEDRQRYSLVQGDVLFTRTSETIEEIGFASTCTETIPNAVFSGFLIRFRPTSHKIYYGYSKYFFRSVIHRAFFVKEMNLVTRASLSQDLLKNLPVVLPTIEEQQAIATYLDEKTSQIDSLIALKQSKIESLKEYKKSIIYEYVTGKKRV